MISKQYFEETFSLATAQALQSWADNNLIVVGRGDYAMTIAYSTVGEMFAETEVTGLTIGNEYTIKTDTIDLSINQYRTYINAVANDNTSSVAELGYGTGVRSFVFTATAETMYIAIGDVVGVASSHITVDNISLKIDGVEAVPNGTFEGNNTTGWYAQNGNASLSVYAYAVEPPVIDDNPYIETVNIPVYDAGNPEHFLIDSVNKWNENDLNSASHKHFYLESLDFIPQGRVQITRSGTASDRRTVSLLNATDHPGKLDQADQASIAFELVGASYWTFHRVSSLSGIFLGNIKTGASWQFSSGSTYNIIDECYTTNLWLPISINNLCHNNTIQKCFFDGLNSGANSLDVSQIIFVEWGGDGRMYNNKIILNEFKDFKAIKLHDSEGSPGEGPYFDGLVIDSNIMWFSDDVRCDSDGTPNPAGNYGLAEAGQIGVKTGAETSTTPVTITNNQTWGGWAIYPDAPPELSGPAANFSLSYYGAKFMTYRGNVVCDIDSGINVADRYDEARGTWGVIVENNIYYEVGVRPESSGVMGSMIMSQAEDYTSRYNVIKNPRDNWSTVIFNYYNNYFGQQDIINIDQPIIYENNNEAVEGLDPVDTNNYHSTAEGDAIFVEDYTISYDKYTNSPKTRVIPNVLKVPQSDFISSIWSM